jgi:hypothetical protein
VIPIRPFATTLFFIMPILALTFTACGSIDLTSGDLDEIKCSQLRERLAEKTLTEARVAETKRDMEKAGCWSLLP